MNDTAFLFSCFIISGVLSFYPFFLYSLSSSSLPYRHPFLDPYHTLQRPELPLTVYEYDEYGDINDSKVLEYILNYSPYSNIQDSLCSDIPRSDDIKGCFDRNIQDSTLGNIKINKNKFVIDEMQNIINDNTQNNREEFKKIKDMKRDKKNTKEERSYPAMFVSTGLLDALVGPWEGVKWVRRIRDGHGRNSRDRNEKNVMNTINTTNTTDGTNDSTTRNTTNVSNSTPHNHLLLLQVTADCGHEGPYDEKEGLRLMAVEVAFLEKAIGRI